MSTVYLLHFSERYQHAQHYLGSTGRSNVADRLAEHQAGQGSKLTAAAVNAGIVFTVAQTWPGGRTTERSMKGRSHGSSTSWVKRCPICKAAKQG